MADAPYAGSCLSTLIILGFRFAPPQALRCFTLSPRFAGSTQVFTALFRVSFSLSDTYFHKFFKTNQILAGLSARRRMK
jgi:hypothetical protein